LVLQNPEKNVLETGDESSNLHLGLLRLRDSLLENGLTKRESNEGRHIRGMAGRELEVRTQSPT
jgi:hypothetical protein